MVEPILELKGVYKRFAGVVALNNVDISVYPGEVLALIGENGAGKSTLMKILSGVHSADEGTLRIDGNEVQIRTVADAQKLGVSLIHQELNNLDNLDVGGNIFLGREPRYGGPLNFVDTRKINENSKTYLKKVGLNVSPSTSLGALSIAQQQLVEIAKALSTNARIIVMDEPTSCLTLTETNRLLELIKELKNAGVSVIYISHRLMEVNVCADRVVALRDGKNSGQLSKEEINHDNMVRLMIGRNLDLKRTETRLGDPNKTIQIREYISPFFPSHKITFDIRKGEILGLAGLVGAGRSELAITVFGIARPLGGEVIIDNTPIVVKSPKDAIKNGIYLVPEDRRKTGLVTTLSVRENISLPDLWRYASMGLISYKRELAAAEEQRKRLSIKTAHCDTPAKNLSGGNQQKVVLAKWLSLNPKLIIFDEPTRGVDVGSKAEIYRLMRELADNGVYVLMISSDMEEVLGVSDRIVVMREGALMGILEAKDFSEEAVMKLAVAPIESAAA
jgi:ribose transport system ATP-binding protein